MDSESESKLVSLITRLMFPEVNRSTLHWTWDPRIRSFIDEVMSMVRSIDLDSQPKPETEFMSLTTQLISLLRSIDLDSQPKPLSELISLISRSPMPAIRFIDCLYGTLRLDPEPEVISLIHQILSLVIAMNSSKLISLFPQIKVKWEEGKFQVGQVASRERYNKWDCLPLNWILIGEEGTTYFYCQGCNGVNHKEYKKASCEIKHTFHPRHSLQLVFLHLTMGKRRECYCCNEDLRRVFYYCSDCDFAINFVCVEKPVDLSKNERRWHEHPLSLFPRQNSLTCNVCALTHSARSSGPFYMCPPCDFVIHQSCISLPRLIRISRHPHRISFTFFFYQRDLSCRVCRTKIDNKCGGYSCIKDGCSYAAHSKCATQSNVWDGLELYGKLEEEEEEEDIEPFLKISDGVIQHFSHQHHHLRLDENTNRDYDENNQCQACITPVYFGNFYSCMQCDFILHEDCANLSRKMYHPIHPHQLTLVARYDGDLDFQKDRCSACCWFCKAGFFYECVGCDFKLHVQCATISEPLVHESHMHPLFLTSKPGDEKRSCSACEGRHGTRGKETFNCIECDFALCFMCATWPRKVRYKHDKHTLTLSCGKNTSTMTAWCEVCETEIEKERWFYMCDEYCCVTLHIDCLLGFPLYDFYIKSSSSGFCYGEKVHVLPNNHHMSRPICPFCQKRCQYKIVFKWSGIIFCSSTCLRYGR